MKVAVVTPSIGQDTLTQCLLSVQKQEYEDIVHYVFIDGYEHKESIINQIFLKTFVLLLLATVSKKAFKL